jgi:hypothetical protein
MEAAWIGLFGKMIARGSCQFICNITHAAVIPNVVSQQEFMTVRALNECCALHHDRVGDECSPANVEHFAEKEASQEVKVLPGHFADSAELARRISLCDPPTLNLIALAIPVNGVNVCRGRRCQAERLAKKVFGHVAGDRPPLKACPRT